MIQMAGETEQGKEKLRIERFQKAPDIKHVLLKTFDSFGLQGYGRIFASKPSAGRAQHWPEPRGSPPSARPMGISK